MQANSELARGSSFSRDGSTSSYRTSTPEVSQVSFITSSEEKEVKIVNASADYNKLFAAVESLTKERAAFERHSDSSVLNKSSKTPKLKGSYSFPSRDISQGASIEERVIDASDELVVKFKPAKIDTLTHVDSASESASSTTLSAEDMEMEEKDSNDVIKRSPRFNIVPDIVEIRDDMEISNSDDFFDSISQRKFGNIILRIYFSSIFVLI